MIPRALRGVNTKQASLVYSVDRASTLSAVSYRRLLRHIFRRRWLVTSRWTACLIKAAFATRLRHDTASCWKPDRTTDGGPMSSTEQLQQLTGVVGADNAVSCRLHRFAFRFPIQTDSPIHLNEWINFKQQIRFEKKSACRFNSYSAVFLLVMWPSSGAALSVAPFCLSVRPSVPCLRFSRNRKAVETSNLVQT